jgi:hypothetical protein
MNDYTSLNIFQTSNKIELHLSCSAIVPSASVQGYSGDIRDAYRTGSEGHEGKYQYSIYDPESFDGQIERHVGRREKEQMDHQVAKIRYTHTFSGA